MQIVGFVQCAEQKYGVRQHIIIIALDVDSLQKEIERIATTNTLKYLKQNFATIEPVEFFGNTYYQIGTDDWNIIVGLGGLTEIANQANKIIKEYIDKLDEKEVMKNG